MTTDFLLFLKFRQRLPNQEQDKLITAFFWAGLDRVNINVEEPYQRAQRGILKQMNKDTLQHLSNALEILIPTFPNNKYKTAYQKHLDRIHKTLKK